MSLGDHCEVEECKQIDFLPFKCDACEKVFCLAHRKYSAHSCKKAGEKETQTIICPLCAKAIKLLPDQDANAAFERHSQEACDPMNYAKVHKKARCPVPNCKEKLGSVNTYSCKTCGTSVCLRHRFPGDHDCTGRSAARKGAQQMPIADKMRNLFGLGSSGPSDSHRSQASRQPTPVQKSSKASQPAPARPAASAATRAAAEAAERRRLQPRGAQSSGSAASERCPQCGETFRTLQELLFHADAFHSASGHHTAGGMEQCPQCGQYFADAVALVEHVEQQHRSKELCVLC
ncbi:Zinc finger AN1 and C2H2 domain-containing stress-stress-associated protein [Coccomyxa sp. Obi]|nr:Zinc finger AN1 and C2H2 domain-containing stress-stress-associated protein [Coccomyxa sp. Obi]